MEQGHPCRIEGCTRFAAKGKGWVCPSHQHRIHRYGDPFATSPTRPRGEYGRSPTVRLLERIDWDGPGGCWLAPANAAAGYSSIATGILRHDGKTRTTAMLAHRFMWWLITGECPVGELDHLCYRPNCVRFDHLREVSRQENLEAGNVRRRKERAALQWIEEHHPEVIADL